MDLLDKMTSAIGTVDEEQGRIYGCLTGPVTDVDDKLMRVKARLGKQEDSASTDWLLPMTPGAIESLPEVNEMVGVVFQDGDVHRGFYFYFPQSTTKNRPKEHALLGDTLAALFNNLASQFNALRDDFRNHVHLGASTVCTNGAAWTGSTNPPTGGTTSSAAGQVQDASGQTVAGKSGDAVALSKRILVR